MQSSVSVDGQSADLVRPISIEYCQSIVRHSSTSASYAKEIITYITEEQEANSDNDTKPNPNVSNQIDSTDVATGSDPNTATSPTARFTTSMWICFICVQFLIFSQLSSLISMYLVIPFYVASTPEHGWTVTNLSIIFGIYNFGAILSSQICMIAQCSPSRRNTILFMGHLMQFVMGIIGFLTMSSFFGFNLPLFYAAAFMVGLNANITVIEAYGPLISDNVEFQKMVLGSIGKAGLCASILQSFTLTTIYERMGFQMFCGAMTSLLALGVVVLCILWSLIKRTTEGTKQETAAGILSGL